MGVSLCRLYAAPAKALSHLYGASTHLRTNVNDMGETMLDLMFVILGAALFLGALVYARACAQV